MSRKTEDALVAVGFALLLFSALWNAPVAAAGSILLLALVLARESARRPRRQ